jgi:hypothetical protein
MVRRTNTRGVTAIEAAVGFALIGSLLAVAVPAFMHNLSASRLSEATGGLARIGEHAISEAAQKSCADAFPATVPLTPETVPRGHAVVDSEPDPWQHPTWKALDFRPSVRGVAHWYAFAFERVLNPAKPDAADFVATAHGDLDGDGTQSTFELRGQCRSGSSALAPGMYVEAELE